MLTYPNIDPIAVSLGPLKVHWYGLMYLLAFLCAWGLATYRAKQRTDWTSEMVSDLVFYGALGVVIGGRIGYVLFYEFDQFLAHPIWLFQVWTGGMSFHGGFIGVMVAMILWCRKYQKHGSKPWILLRLAFRQDSCLVVSVTLLVVNSMVVLSPIQTILLG